MSSPPILGGASLFTGFTKLCKGLAVVLVAGHIVVQIFPSAVNYLALIPASPGGSSLKERAALPGKLDFF